MAFSGTYLEEKVRREQQAEGRSTQHILWRCAGHRASPRATTLCAVNVVGGCESGCFWVCGLPGCPVGCALPQVEVMWGSGCATPDRWGVCLVSVGGCWGGCLSDSRWVCDGRLCARQSRDEASLPPGFGLVWVLSSIDGLCVLWRPAWQPRALPTS